MEKENLIKSESLNYGFPQKTIIFDSQTAPPLRGIPSEQVFKRMYLMGEKEDIVLHEEQYPIDSVYLDYLGLTLNLELPQFVSVQNMNSGTLTKDVLEHPETMSFLKIKMNEGYKMQFFNLTEDLEAELISRLGNETYAQNFEGVMELGTKTGFRNFCEKYEIPISPGGVCNSMEELEKKVLELANNSVLLKARNGTAGAELGSNVEIIPEEIGQYKEEGILDELLNLKIEKLSPKDFPMVAETKLPYPNEGSVHIFLDSENNIVYRPNIIGQIAEKGSYKGGFYPNNLSSEFEEKVLKLASEKIVPALQAEGLGGFHCFDFLYDEDLGEFAFIEDNTRPGALDFIYHFVEKVAEANDLGSDLEWFTKNVSLEKMNMNTATFAEIKSALGDLLDPNSSISRNLGGFVLISNPDVLPYGGDLNLTVVGLENSKIDLKTFHRDIVSLIKSKN